jgi:predicted small metal-binding protein
MAKSITCADVGADCNWSTTAETEEELMKKVAQHAKEEHEGMEVTPELVEKIKSKIKEI